MKRLVGIRRAHAIINRFHRAKVLVIGDLIMDHFIWGSVKRISPEAPVPVVDVKSESIMLGGSANVANNIRSLGGRTLISGVVGKDNDGRRLIRDLKEMGIESTGVVADAHRPTTIKTRVIAHGQQVVRFDRESRERISPKVAGRVLDFACKAARIVDAVIISDYAKGVVTAELVLEVNEIAKKRGIPVAVDPKVEHFDYYKGVTIVTPNNIEASRASGVEIDDDESLHRAGEILYNGLGCKALLITRGESGMSLFEDTSDLHIPTVAKEVFDVSGAGDTVIGVLGLALGSGASFREAAVLANFAAGIVVGKVGTATVTAGELKSAVSKAISGE